MQNDNGDWKELRARVDSVASAIFLIAGGALTLSITVILNLKQTVPLVKSFANETSIAWYALLTSIICFVVLKVWIIGQSFARGLINPEKYNSTIIYTNSISWLIGLVGLVAFIIGMLKLVVVAIGVVNV